MAREDEVDLVHGSGNVFRDFGDPDADVKQTKGILAAKITGILDDRNLSTRKAQALTGIDQAEFVRIRNAKLDRFTIDLLMTIINKLDHHGDIQVEVRPATAQA